MQDSDYYGRNNAWFVGVVEDTVDDAYVKVRVFGIHPIDRVAVPTEMLPNALIVYPVTGGQVNSGSISHNLSIDSWVVGFWADWPLCQQPIVTGTVQGTDYSMSTYESQGGEFVGEGGGDQSIPGETPSGEGEPEVNTGETTNIPGGSNVQKTYNYITTRLQSEQYNGDKHIAASAMCGVLMLETPGINPNVVGGYKGRAWGICQWLGARRNQLFRKYGRTKRLDQQLDFAWWELNNSERRAKQLWLGAHNLPDAVAGFCMFERAEEVKRGRVIRSHGNYKKRLKYAYQVYNSIKSTGNAQVSAPRLAGPV